MATTKEKEICYKETNEHISRVRFFISKIVKALLDRADVHDASKLQEPEFSLFAQNGSRLRDLKYGSPEYENSLKDLTVAIQHHYATNRHHPEHHKNGIEDMNLVDLVEMFVDWKAASERQNNGNIRLSIEKCCEKFNICPQLRKIFENSVDLLG